MPAADHECGRGQAGRHDSATRRLSGHGVLAVQRHDRPSLGFDHHHLQHQWADHAPSKFLAQSALNAWHEVANVTFVQTTGAANITFNHNGSMTAFETDNYNGAGIMSSATVDISADWITTDGGAQDGKTGIDSYGYQTYIHEIGHALGLGHQGPYNGSASLFHRRDSTPTTPGNTR